MDKNGKFVTAWGEPGRGARGQGGAPPEPETRPAFFNNVHGVAFDPMTRQVYVNDRGNRRIQVFDENGKFIRMFSMQAGTSGLDLHFVHMDADRRLWVFDQVTQQLAQLDREGHLINAWGGPGGVAWRAVRRAWHRHRSGSEPLSRGGRSRWRAEVPSATGRQSRISGGQARVFSVEVRRHG
jgi:hypothetical protein